MSHIVKNNKGQRFQASKEFKPGQRVGDLLITKRIDNSNNKLMYQAECICGSVIKVERLALATGQISCNECSKKYAQEKRKLIKVELTEPQQALIRSRFVDYWNRLDRIGQTSEATTFERFREEIISDPDFPENLIDSRIQTSDICERRNYNEFYFTRID